MSRKSLEELFIVNAVGKFTLAYWLPRKALQLHASKTFHALHHLATATSLKKLPLLR